MDEDNSECANMSSSKRIKHKSIKRDDRNYRCPDKSNTVTADDIDNINVNINYLQPVNTQCIVVTVNGIQIKALIDTGGARSLIKESECDKLNIKPYSEDSMTIHGLGHTTLKTKGSIKVDLEYFGQQLVGHIDICADKDINYPIILGMEFLKENMIIIDMTKQKISKTNSDDSLINVYLDENGEVINVVRENVPVYCKEKTIVKSGETMKVPVFANTSSCMDPQLNLFYFEGNPSNKKIETISGIIDQEEDDKYILVKATEGSRVGSTIKKGNLVGRMSTVLSIEVDKVDGDKGNKKWTLDKLREEVELQDNINDVQKELVYDMLVDTRGALSTGDADIGKAKVVPHHIDLTENTPIWQKPRIFAEPVNREIEEQCNELLVQDILEHSDSNWSSPVVPVRKTDGTLRLCIDYRKVNQITKGQQFPMPNISNSIYKGHNVQYFTKLDLVRGYYQVPLDEASREITAFSTTKNHFQFKRLSFGLKNSGIAFQKTMQQVLSPFASHNIIIYIDDILIMSETFYEH